MPPENKNKLNKLEELKNQLFNKNFKTKIEHRDSYSHNRTSDIPDSWEEPERSASVATEKFFMQSSRFKKFFVFSVIFFVLAVAYAAFVLFAGGNIVSNDNIDISILGNNFTAGGEELSLIIGITNRNNTTLDLVDLVVEYPKGSEEDSFAGTERLRESLGSIPAGAERNENLKLVLFGQEGSTKTIKVSIEYRVAGSNAIFVKDKAYNVILSSTPLNLFVDAPSTVSPNQSITFNVKTVLNATKPASKVLVKADYPLGFTFTGANPAPSYGNNVWDLGDLAPGTEREIAITGKMVDVFDGEEKVFNIISGSQSLSNKAEIDVIFNSVSQLVLVQKPFVEANLFINGVYQREYAIYANAPVSATIRYANNLDTKVNDLEIQAKISGNAFNRQSVSVQRGFYDSTRDVITWNQNTNGELSELNPGEFGSVTFSITPLATYSPAGGILNNPSFDIDVDISGKQDTQGFATSEINNSSSATFRIISDVAFAAKALYYSGAFSNSGPIPPKAEQKTTYTLVWSIANTANTLSNARVSASLPPWVEYENVVSPVGENISFNSSTRQITWNVGKVAKGAGITGVAREVSFKISLIPSLSQAGTSPTLVNGATLTAHDDFANADIKASKNSLNTRLFDDPSFPANGSIVIQ